MFSGSSQSAGEDQAVSPCPREGRHWRALKAGWEVGGHMGRWLFIRHSCDCVAVTGRGPVWWEDDPRGRALSWDVLCHGTARSSGGHAQTFKMLSIFRPLL